MRTLQLLATAVLFCSCASTPIEDSAFGPEQELVTPVSLEGWRPENIPFPPEFAPTLPAGEEDLLFAPGMFVVGAEDYWSYAFIVQLHRELNEPSAVLFFLDDYFDGLLATVAKVRKHPKNPNPAKVNLRPLRKNRFEADVELVDVFNDLQPIILRMEILTEPTEKGGTNFKVQASPQPAGHKVWDSLRAASKSLDRLAAGTDELELPELWDGDSL